MHSISRRVTTRYYELTFSSTSAQLLKVLEKKLKQRSFDVTMWESNNADINTNILNWDFNTYKPKDFDVI